MRKCESITFIWYISIVTFATYVRSGCVIFSDATTKNPCNTSMLPSTEVCGTSTEDQIIGGDEADLYDFPWFAILKFRVKEEVFCGGVLIHERYIVTAAHCVLKQSNYKLITVRLGEHNLKTKKDCKETVGGFKKCADPPVDVGIEQIIIHSNHRSRANLSVMNDIALVRLAQKVIFTDFIKPICLPIVPELLGKTFEGQTHHIAGFGFTENDKKSDVKLKAEVPVLSNSKCKEYFSNLITQEHICAGGNKKDTCRGDSGAPLMKDISLGKDTNWYLTGIASFGTDICGKKPGAYVRITEYVNWILDNMIP